MSLSRVTSSSFRPTPVRLGKPNMPRRYLHRAHDQRYLELWKKHGVDYKETANQYQKYPHFVEQILRVSTAARLKGECAFVSAFPASSKILIELYDAVQPAGGNPFFKYLRSPKSKFAQRSLEKARKQMSEERDGFDRSGLLSQSYALTSGVKWLETAASWGFINHYGNSQFFPMASMLRDSLSDKHEYFMEKGLSLIRKYNRLKVGDFYVLSMPWEKVDRYVVDSLPFNVPTGKRTSEVAKHPEKHVDTLLDQGTHMSTLLFCDETLDPDSGISMVRANDPQEVETFCAGHTFTPLKEVRDFTGLVSLAPSSAEQALEEERRKIDGELSQYIEQFKTYLRTGKIQGGVKLDASDQVEPGDIPSLTEL